MKFKYLSNTKFNLPKDTRTTLRYGESYEVVEDHPGAEYAVVINEIGERQVVLYFMGEKEECDE